MRSQPELYSPGGRGGDSSASPEPGYDRQRYAGRTEPAVECPPEQDELDPAGDPGRRGEAGRAPPRIEPQLNRQGNGEQVSEDDGQRDADDRKPERRPGVVQGVVGRGIQPPQVEASRPTADPARIPQTYTTISRVKAPDW